MYGAAQIVSLPREVRDTSEIQRLKDRIGELEGLLGLRVEFPIPGLRPRVNRVLGCFTRRRIYKTESLFTAAWGGDTDLCGAENVRNAIWHARRGLRQYGIEIRTIFGRYEISADDQKKLIALMIEGERP